MYLRSCYISSWLNNCLDLPLIKTKGKDNHNIIQHFFKQANCEDIKYSSKEVWIYIDMDKQTNQERRGHWLFITLIPKVLQ